MFARQVTDLPKLSSPAMIVLLQMATLARDAERVYFGGWGRLAWALGYYPDEEGRAHGAGKRAVARAVAELRAAKRIEATSPVEGKPPRTRAYLIR